MLTYTIRFILILFNMSASGSVLVCCCFVDWYCRYESAVIDVGFMCCLLHVICLPLVVRCIVYDLLWWLWSPVPMVIPWVHGLPSSCWTTTVDHMGIYAKTGEASLLFLCCLSTSLWWWLSSQSCPIGLQSTIGMLLQTGLLNMSVAKLSKPWPNGVVQICSRAIFMSLPDSVHYLNVHFMNLIQDSTCLLLWYANNTAWSTLMALQNCQNLSETKFVLASDVIFWVCHIWWILFLLH